MKKDLSQMTGEELGRLFPISVEPPRAEYAARFASECRKIRLVVGDGPIVRLSHIGSTSVPGLAAKPTVDMLLEIRPDYPLETLKAALTSSGYLFCPQPKNPPPHAVFYKGYTPEGFSGEIFHLHVRYPGDWNELYFCDYLRTHPDAAAEYGRLKLVLARKFRFQRDDYTAAKGEFILTHTARARAEMPGKYHPEFDVGYWQRIPPDKKFTTRFPIERVSAVLGADAALLDVGCGYGRTLAELHEAGFRNLSGTDVSASLLERARCALPGGSFQVQEPGVLDYPDGSFDGVLLLAVLTCIPRDADQIALRDEIIRVLRPGGWLFATDFLLNNDPRNRARYAQYEPRYGTFGVFELPEAGVTLRHHDEAYLKHWLEPFAAMDWEETFFPTMNGHSSRGFCVRARRR